MDDYKFLGTKLKEIRQKRGLKQSELADKLFVSRRCIGYWESGHRKPDIEMLRKMAEILKFDVHDLLSSKNNMSAPYEIILVEDEKVILDCFTDILRQAIPDITITGFEDSFSAYNYSKEHNICVAFLDIELFGSSGITLAQKLSALNPNINIIFLTGHPEYALDALDIFCSGYILKPLTMEKIKNQMDHLRFPISRLA